MAPCTEAASSLMNLRVVWKVEEHNISKGAIVKGIIEMHTAIEYKPHFAVSSERLLRFTGHDNGATLSVTT